MSKLMFLCCSFILLYGCSVIHQSVQESNFKIPISVQFRLADKSPQNNAHEMKIKGTGEVVYLYTDSVLDQADIKSASVRQSVTGVYDLIIFFTINGSKKFSKITANNIGKRLGLVIDGELLSAPLIKGRISGEKIVITGKFTEKEAKDIANRINLTVKR